MMRAARFESRYGFRLDPSTEEPLPTEAPTPPPTEEPPTATPTPPIEKIFTCQKGAKFNVSPEETEVWIEGKKIGMKDWFRGVRTFWRYRKG